MIEDSIDISLNLVINYGYFKIRFKEPVANFVNFKSYYYS